MTSTRARRPWPLLAAGLVALVGVVWLSARVLAPTSDRDHGPVSGTQGPGTPAGTDDDVEATPGLASAPRAAAAGDFGSPDGVSVETERFVVGRVVDEARRAVAAAIVTGRRGDTTWARATSDADGTFRLAVLADLRDPKGTDAGSLDVVVAEHGGRRATASPVGARAGRLPDLVLRDAYEIEVVVMEGTRAAAGARVYVRGHRPWDVAHDLHARTGTGTPFLGWEQAASADASGRVVVRSARGDLRVRAFTATGRGEAFVAIDGPRRVEVRLDAARDLEVEVVEMGRGAPVAGVRVAVETSEDGRFPSWWLDDPDLPAPTDGSGRTRIKGLSRVPLALTVVGKGWLWPPWRSAVIVDAQVESVRLEVPPAETVLRLPATFLDGPAPPEGTPVVLEPDPDEVRGFQGPMGLPTSVGEIRAGHLEIDGLRNEHLFGRATLPDGRVARFGDRPTVFAAPRAVIVQVVEEEGGGAAGVVVVVRDDRGRTLAVGRTDGAGRLRVPALPPAVLEVVAEVADDFVEETRHGVFESELVIEADTRAGDAEVGLVRPREVDASIVVTVAGRPGFPPAFGLRVGLAPASIEYVDPPGATWDAATGSVRFRVRRPTGNRTLAAIARAPGHTTVRTTLRTDPDRLDLRAAIDLVPAGTLDLVGPSGPDGVQGWLERRGADELWKPVEATPRPTDGGDGRQRLADVPVGTYRLRDPSSGAISPMVEVGAGAVETLSLVLPHRGLIDVHVHLEGDLDPARLVIEREGPGLVLDAEGPFWVARRIVGSPRVRWTVPGDRPVRIVVHHPEGEPTTGAGLATVEVPGEPLHFRLRPRPR